MKRICIFLLILLLAMAVPVVAAAEQPLWIFDEAELMSQAEAQALDTMAQKLSDTYQLNIAIVTTDTLAGKSPRSYAEDWYDQTYGVGTDGILFLLSMEDRDWYISTNGRGTELLTDDEVDDSFDDVKKYISGGEYFTGFEAWLDNLPFYLDSQTSGATGETQGPNVLISLGIGLAVAVIVILIMRASMNTRRKQQSARQYLVPGSYHLNTCQDFYLYSRTTQTAKPKDNGSGSSGGSSRGGGGGKF